MRVPDRASATGHVCFSTTFGNVTDDIILPSLELQSTRDATVFFVLVFLFCDESLWFEYLVVVVVVAARFGVFVLVGFVCVCCIWFVVLDFGFGFVVGCCCKLLIDIVIFRNRGKFAVSVKKGLRVCRSNRRTPFTGGAEMH